MTAIVGDFEERPVRTPERDRRVNPARSVKQRAREFADIFSLTEPDSGLSRSDPEISISKQRLLPLGPIRRNALAERH